MTLDEIRKRHGGQVGVLMRRSLPSKQFVEQDGQIFWNHSDGLIPLNDEDNLAEDWVFELTNNVPLMIIDHAAPYDHAVPSVGTIDIDAGQTMKDE